MGMLVRLAVLVLVFCAPARAAEVEVGTAPICDTRQQMERLASLFASDAPAPIQIVNAEARDPSACGIASNVEYVRGSPIATVRTKDVTWEVVEILVVGVVTPEGARTIAPAVYYSLLRLDERPV